MMTLSGRIYQKLRRIQYRLFSTCQNVIGTPEVDQPVQFAGKGRIEFKGKARLGFFPSPFYYSGYIYLEARSATSVIEIEEGVWINNNSFIVSDGPGIFIGAGTMLGTHCEILDSDFHDTSPGRTANTIKTGKVVIGKNVIIGSNVRILRGVRIGDNTVIANSTVVTRSVPANMIVYGNPQKVGLPMGSGQPAAAVAS